MKLLLSAIVVLITNSAFAVTDSVYTSLKVEDCIAINASYLLPEDEQEIDYYEGVCPSFGGYQIGVSGGDIRYSVTLSYNGTEIELPRLYQFHDAGEVAEWRYVRGAVAPSINQVVYTSLIYRLNYSDYQSNGDIVEKSKLVVVRLNKENSCVIGIIDNQSRMNERARVIADDGSAPCMTNF